MLSKLAVRRLTKLADFMDALPLKAKNHFNMGEWFTHKGDHAIKSLDSALKSLDCGTAACAAGWACSIPEFKKAGLFLANDIFSVPHPAYKEMRHSDAIDEFFDGKVFKPLFRYQLQRTIKTPKQWAKHCRKFIKENT